MVRSILLLMLGVACQFLAAVPPAIQAQVPTAPLAPSPRPVATAQPTSERIVIDGRLQEPAWGTARMTTDFVQREPQTGNLSTERTEVRFLYDAETLYVGATLFESDMDALIYGGLEHDFAPFDADLFGIALDPHFDRRNAFIIDVNPGGAVWDAQTFNNGRDINAAWNALVEVQTTLSDSFWTVEIAIPFTTLRFDDSKPVQEWGMNMVRRIRRKNESTYWAGLDRQEDIHKMSEAGTLVGLRNLDQGRNLRLKPYSTAGSRSGGVSDDGAEMDAGLDVKYGITPALTLDATYRTDFSEVDVDQAQVNLTRFPLFFPEQREFFIENRGIFAFGDQAERSYRTGATLQDFTLFHSRRIGLTPGGEPIDIVGGGRLSGRTGRFEVGLLGMQTEGQEGMPGETFGVARARMNFLGNSDAGAILIDRETNGGAGGFNRSFGVDANIRLLRYLAINTYLAGSAGPGGESDGAAGRVAVGWRDRLWDVTTFVKRVDEDFDPGVGFIQRTGMQHIYGTIGMHPRTRGGPVLQFNPYLETDYITDMSSQLDTKNLVAGLATLFRDDGLLTIELRDQYERLLEPFRVFPGVSVPQGGYDFFQASLSYEAGRSRALRGGVRLSTGEFYDGDRTSVGVTAIWRPLYNLYLDASLDQNAVTLPTGSFNARVASTRVRYALSRDLFASAYVQYSAASDLVVSNIRFNYRWAPLSDIFLVYTERHEQLRPTQRLVTLKVTRLLTF